MFPRSRQTELDLARKFAKAIGFPDTDPSDRDALYIWRKHCLSHACDPLTGKKLQGKCPFCEQTGEADAECPNHPGFYFIPPEPAQAV